MRRSDKENYDVEGDDDAFQTDDERVCVNVDNDEDDESTESETGSPSPNSSPNCLQLNHSPSWPQSFRESMDMFKGLRPPSISFPKGNNTTRLTGTNPLGDYQSSDDETSLGKPFISERTLDEEVPATTLPESQQIISVNRSMPSPKQCSFSQALVNGINVLTGIGLLTTPYAVKEGGWLSLTLLLIFGVIACYTGILLKRCLESSPGLQTYPDIGQAAFGITGRLVIAVTLYAELYAACVEYVIIISENLSTIFPNTSIEFGGIYLNAHQIFAIIGILIVLPTVWLRDLSLLSYLSVGGVGASILVVICLLWVGTVDQVGFPRAGTTLNLANIPISIGHSVFPNIYTSMKEPSRFPLRKISPSSYVLTKPVGIMNFVNFSFFSFSIIFCWFMSTGAAISGFLIFGDSVESQFTLNMPTKFAASKIAVWTVVIITISKYALTLTPIALSLEELVPTTWLTSYGGSILIRAALVISTLVVALKVPFFAFLMALAGSLLTMLITIIFPCACYLSIRGGGLTNLQRAVCICTAMLGLLIACDGTYSAVIRIAGQN
ncbi:hypothetical protein CXB51_023221 [Gossypium anomalum]|uniref:Amino acid transporter transmembrane domain-containing protein n=1 Tax=Gossypium anomalum TaxID=47600 RepID=A0A8J5YQ46_9ROSI|nr:hypothetical protein CXB51_023221 [Gossypium anomalum]